METINQRCSCRKFSSRPVPRDVLEQIIAAAQKAPSAMGRSPWVFEVACTPSVVQEINKTTGKQSYGAPVLAFIGIKNGIPGYEQFDAGLACENLCLAATALGVGSVILAYNYPHDTYPAVKQLLHLDDDVKLAIGVALGYPEGANQGHPHPAPVVHFH